MYIAHYTNETNKIAQILITLPLLSSVSGNGENLWQSRWMRAVSTVITIPNIEISWRISITGRRIVRQLLLIAPESFASQLTSVCEMILGLNAVVPDSIESCANRVEHDRLRNEFPLYRAWVRGIVHEIAPGWMGFDFRLRPFLSDLCAQALTAGWDISFQFNIRPLLASNRPDILREIRKNLVRLQAERNLPVNLLQQQAALVERFNTAKFFVDEYFGTDSPDALSDITEWLYSQFSIGTGQCQFDLPIDLNEHLEIPLITGFHTSYFYEIEPRTAIVSTLSPTEVTELLCWEPTIGLRILLVNAVSVGSDNVLQRLEQQINRIESSLDNLNSVGTCKEMRKAIEIHRADPPFALAKARSILEEIVTRLYYEQYPKKTVKPLFNMIEDLMSIGNIFPKNIATYFHAVRVIGNLVVHNKTTETSPISVQDVEIGLLMILSIIEWYLFRDSVRD